MPEFIVRTLQGTPLLLQWYQWGVIVGFVVALAITAWIFIDAQRSGQDATIWKSLAAVSSVIGIPALLARFSQNFALDMQSSLALILIFSIVGAVLGLAAAVGYVGTRGRAATVCPICGQPQDPTWTQCPYHSAPEPMHPISGPIPISNPAPPIASTPFGGNTMSSPTNRETMVGGVEPPFKVAANAPAPRQGGTVFLDRDSAPEPLALLIIKSGPYANTTLPLKAGVNTIGRDGRVNDHPIDDPAVSERHLSIRFQNGRFTATDLDSSNGTFINNQRIDKQTLESNDLIRIGKTELVFVQVGQAAATTDKSTSDSAQ